MENFGTVLLLVLFGSKEIVELKGLSCQFKSSFLKKAFASLVEAASCFMC